MTKIVIYLKKVAYFNIAVTMLTATVICVGYIFVGAEASGGFILLGLLAFAPLFGRGKNAQFVIDERDVQVSRSSKILAFWCTGITCFTLTMFAPTFYGKNGCIPISVAQFILIAACMLFVVIESITVLYRIRRENRQKP